MKRIKSVIAALALMCAFGAPVFAGDTELPGKCPAGQICRPASPALETLEMDALVFIATR